MPILGLSLSLLFSLIMIVRDCKKRRSVSWAVWIPTLLLMVIGSRTPGDWIASHSRQVVELANNQQGSIIDQLFFLVILISAFLVDWVRRFRWSALFRNNSFLIVYYLYFAASILWSSDPSGSAKRLIKDFGLLFVAGVIFTEVDPAAAMRAVYVRSAYLLLPLSVVLIKYFPTYGRSYGLGGDMLFTGVATQKNGLGEIVLLFTLFMVWDYIELRPPGSRFRLKGMPWEFVVLLLTAIWLLRISQSKTSLVCFGVGLLLLLRSRRFRTLYLNRAVLAGALSLPALLFFSQQFSDLITPLLKTLGRDATFTGRTQIWQHITLQTVNPLIGSGYWNFWGGPGGLSVNQEMDSLIPNAHNGYLDIYLDGGIIGVILLFAILIVWGVRTSKSASSKKADRMQLMRFAILIVAIVYNLSESVYFRMGPIWFTTLLMTVQFPKRSLRTVPKLSKLPDESRVVRDAPTFAGL
jgi:exopolysaccharide production protein ExoQ